MAIDSRRIASRLLFSLVLLTVTTSSVPSACAQNVRFAEYELEMYVRPDLPVPVTITAFPDGLMELWLRALERPDAELTRLIIDSISLAHRRGLEETRAAIPKLIQLAQEPALTAGLARAIAAALIELDAQEHSETLAELAVKHGSPVGRVVEPALIKWNSPAMESTWLRRLETATDTESSMILAMEGLGHRRVAAATERLKSITQDVGKSMPMRLAAARALGRIESSGNVDFARRVAEATARPPELGPWIAMCILGSHTDSGGIELLKEFADHPRTAVQSQALGQLFEIDPGIVDELAVGRLDRPDVNVRRWFAKAFFESRNADHIALHCRLIDDQNPSLRREVARDLITLAEDDDLRPMIIEETTKILNADRWQGCEQACVVLTTLDHRPSGGRMVELLDHDRIDVQVAAAWGLKNLRIKDLLPDMLEHANRIFEQFDAGELNDDIRPGSSLQVAHLFLAFGDQRYRESADLLIEYVPKRFDLGSESRPAAIWALGLIYEGENPEDLVLRLIDRLNDNGGMLPEKANVTRMTAISLARMKATSALDSLRVNARLGNTPSKWAIQQLTGEEPEALQPSHRVIDDWILSPTD